MRAAVPALLVAALLPAAAIGAAHIVDIAWAANAWRHEATIAPGRFFEACGRLDAGSSVRWQFDASAALDFNIHYHQGKDVVYPERRNSVAQGSDTLAVDAAQDYCWMWTNRTSAQARLELRMQR